MDEQCKTFVTPCNGHFVMIQKSSHRLTKIRMSFVMWTHSTVFCIVFLWMHNPVCQNGFLLILLVCAHAGVCTDSWHNTPLLVTQFNSTTLFVTQKNNGTCCLHSGTRGRDRQTTI